LSEQAAAFDLSRTADGQTSLRELASQLAMPASTFHRLDQRRLALEAACPAWASFFLSTGGAEFLRQMMLALHLVFGVMGANGCALICQLLKMLGLEHFVGVSEEAQRKVSHQIQALLADYEAAEVARLAGHVQGKCCTLGVDETFPQRGQVLLVAHDMASNYVLLQAQRPRRDAQTWQDALQPVLKPLAVVVEQVVSDQASALKGLARAMGADHCIDLFHVQQPVAKDIVGPVARRKHKARRNHEEASAKAAEQAAAQTPDDTDRAPRGRQPAQPYAERAFQWGQTWAEAKIRHRFVKAALRGLGWASHPFDLINGEWQTPEQIQTRFEQMTQMLEAASEGMRNKRFGPTMMQLNDELPRLVQQTHRQQGRAEALLSESSFDQKQQHWIKEVVLGWMYLKQAQKKLPNATERALMQDAIAALELRAWQEVVVVLETGQAWQDATALAAQMCEKFQRSTSAIEGFNGMLSLKHHGWRTLTEGKLRAVGVMHNFYAKRGDGTTAAERFFGVKPKDLWTWITERFHTLPLSRCGSLLRPSSVQIH
jgi:hypothetical protein